MAVFRFDLGELRTPELDADGVLHVEAYAARVGVQEYISESGVRREYRPADEVFSPTSLATVSGAPVTVGHPGMVTPRNVRSLRVGVVEGVPARHDHLMAVRLRLDEPSTIEAVLSGTLRELSLGYRCDIDPTPGTTPNGERFDMIQKNVKVNHCALLPAGKARAGSEAAIRLDAVDDAVVEGTKPESDPEPSSKQGEESTSAREGAAEAVAEAVEAAAEAVAEVASEVAESEEGDLNALVAELRERVAQLEALLAAASSRADSAERQVLESDVAAAMPELRMDGVASDDLRRKVVSKYLPGVRMDGVSSETLSGMFQAAVSLARNAPKKSVVGAVGASPDSPEIAKAERDARLRSMCKTSY